MFGGERAFNAENALSLYATSFFFLPADGLYEAEKLAEHTELISRCHVYMVGFVPKVELVNLKKEGTTCVLSFRVLGEVTDVHLPVPEEWKLVSIEDGSHAFEDPDGQRFTLSFERAMPILSAQLPELTFEVKYIGQAYGKDGSRNAIDRLTKHETLQKIALKGVPEGYRLELLLLEVEADMQVLTVISPGAKNTDATDARIKNAIDKLHGTDAKERVALFEAAMIRYFQPDFNKEFKESFPSTNLKILNDCYDKDFSALIVEIGFDHLHVKLCSAVVKPQDHHAALHQLQTEADRQAFFLPE